MRKVKCTVQYPWPGIDDDIWTLDIEDDMTEEEIEQLANETLLEMVLDRVTTNWEIVE